MRKAPNQKLALNRETMRNLQPAQLARVGGAATPPSTVDSHGLCTSLLCGMWTRNDCDGTNVNCPTSGCP